MKKNKLVKELRKAYKDIETSKVNDVKEYLLSHLKDDIKITIVNDENDLKRNNINTTTGFYLIFTDCTDFSVNTLNIKIDETNFYCVYRGHSSTIKNRLKSHLFYDPNGEYPNCMKIKYEEEDYNINISSQKLYKDGEIITEREFPTWKWAVGTLPLSNTKQELRELFELAFDKAFNGRPPFSDR